MISPYRARARRVGAPVPLLAPGRRLPPPRQRRPAALRRRARGAGAAVPASRPRPRTATCSPSLLSRPKRQLWLSWRLADDEGGAAARSPFVDEVRELLDPPLPDDLEERDEALAAEAGGRGHRRVRLRARTPPRARTSWPARSPPASAGRTPGGPGLDGPSPTSARASPRGSPRPPRSRRRSACTPARCACPAVLEQMADEGPVRALDPRGVRDLPLPLVRPARAEPAADRARERRAHRRARWPTGCSRRSTASSPAATARPTAGDAGRLARARRELIDEIGTEAAAARARRRPRRPCAASRASSSPSSPTRPATDAAFDPEPDLFEASFGLEDSDKDAFAISDTAGIHGRIDRIDLGPVGRGARPGLQVVARRSRAARGCSTRGKLQLQLYLLAVRELWGLELAGGVYRPLGGTGRPQAEGPAAQGADRGPRRRSTRGPSDHLADEDFEEALDAAREPGRRRSPAEIQAGEIGRRPDQRQVPRLLHLPADLPPRARAPRGGAGRGGLGGMSRPAADRPAARGGRATRAATSSCARAPAPARPPSWWTASARPRSTPTSASSGSSPSPSPSAPPTSCAAGCARGSRGMAAEEADRRERSSCSARPRTKTERAWISTIHGFCRRLLASHPAAAGIDPRFRVLDEPEADRLAERAFDAALDRLVSGGDPEALELRGLELAALAARDDPRRLRRAPQPGRGRARAARPAARPTPAALERAGRCRRRPRRTVRGGEADGQGRRRTCERIDVGDAARPRRGPVDGAARAAGRR